MKISTGRNELKLKHEEESLDNHVQLECNNLGATGMQ